MRGFEAISEKYYQAGVSLDDIEYAVTAVKFGSNPDNIIENLKVGYKGLNDELANALLQDLLIANTIETKRRKRTIFALGMLYAMVGCTCSYYLLHVLFVGGVLHRPVFVALAAIGGLTIGFFHFSRLLKVNAEV